MSETIWCWCRRDRVNQFQCYQCEPDDESNPCPTCNGCGSVNPLTTPNGFFCVSTTACPSCDGTGELQ